MKKKGLLIILIIVLIILSVALYFFIANSPKRIENESIGTMYTFGQISFNLTSDQYAQNEEVIEAYKERGWEEDEIIILHNEQIDDTLTILKMTDEEQELFDNNFQLFSNPILKISMTRENKKNVHLHSERIEKEEDLKKLEYILYESEDKSVIISSSEEKDDSIRYGADIKIGNLYYTIIPYQPTGENQLALENIMEFIRTVNINQ